MNSLFGDRAMAELVGKLRVLTACELCKKSFNETFLAVSCNHYICKNCVRPTKNECTKCNKPSEILQAQYFDPITETLLKLKELFTEKETLKPTANKRKAEEIILTPTSKISKVTPSTETPKNANAVILFAKKSKPSLADSCNDQRSTPKSGGTTGTSHTNNSQTGCSSEEVLLGSASRSNSTTDSPIIQTDIDKKSRSCSCGNRIPPTDDRGVQDFGIQVSNNVLTLDVAVHAKASTLEFGVQTDGAEGNSRNPRVSSETQTERPYVPVKRYFEVAIQTDEQLDESCNQLSLEPERKSLTSTQAAASANQTVHAQPISLDMSPIRGLKATLNHDENRSMNSAEKDAEDTIDFSTDELIQKTTTAGRTDETLCSQTKDTLDSLDFRTMDFKRKQEEEGSSRVRRRSPEPDSLDSIPSEIFNNLEKPKDEVVRGNSQTKEKDTLESFFKSSEESSIPETEPTAAFSRSERSVARVEPDSPLRLTEKRRTLIVSDDDEPTGKCLSDTRKNRSAMQSKTTARGKGGKQLRNSHSNATKTLPSFSSDEDDVDPLPMDTEDMRNLEKEIENLDREMEDSKGCAKSRFV